MLSPTEEDITVEDKRLKEEQVRDSKSPKLPKPPTESSVNMEAATLTQIMATLATVDEKLKKLDKLDTMETTLNGLAETQTNMQTSITGLQDDVTNLQTKNTSMENELLKTEARFCALERQCAYICKELKKEREINTVNEAIMKRTNLVFSGIEEKEDEKDKTVRETERKMKGRMERKG